MRGEDLDLSTYYFIGRLINRMFGPMDYLDIQIKTNTLARSIVKLSVLRPLKHRRDAAQNMILAEVCICGLTAHLAKHTIFLLYTATA